MATVVIPALLRKLTDGKDRVAVQGRNIGQVIEDLERQFPGLREHLVENGDISRQSRFRSTAKWDRAACSIPFANPVKFSLFRLSVVVRRPPAGRRFYDIG